MDSWDKILSYAKLAIQLKLVPIPLVWKRPLITNWTNITIENALNTIYEAYQQKKCNNIGILCGEKSELIVIDIDVKDQGLQLWETLCKQFGTPDTFIVKTGSGGYHYYFQLDERTKVLKNTTRAIDKKGIDIKTNGGQIVFTGSIHPDTKKEYYPVKGWNDVIKISIMPDWLLNLLIPTKNQNLTRIDGEKTKLELFSKVHEKLAKKYPDLLLNDNETNENKLVDTNINKKPNDNKLVETSMNKEQLHELIKLLSIDRSDIYDFWIKGIWAIKNINEDYRDLAHIFSKKSLKYDSQSVDKIWENAKNKEKSITVATLMLWLKEELGLNKIPYLSNNLVGLVGWIQSNKRWDTLTKFFF